MKYKVTKKEIEPNLFRYSYCGEVYDNKMHEVMFVCKEDEVKKYHLLALKQLKIKYGK